MKKIFTKKEKWIIWIDYMATISNLNGTSLEFKLNSKGIDYSTGVKYPTVGIYKTKPIDKFNIRPFKEFCDETDSRVSAGVIGWYSRFKDRIKL